MILPRGTIIMVADGGRMMLLRNDGDAVSPALTVVEHRETPLPHNRDLFADAPGRSFSSHSPIRSAYDNGDPHTAREHGFLAASLAALAELVDHDTPSIVIAADPVSLGVIREHYTRAITDRLMAELDKDLTAMPVDEILSYLRAVQLPAQR